MKNGKSLLVNGAIALVGVLVLVFMSQAYLSVAGFSIGSGYDMMEISSGMPARYVVLALANIFVCVVAALLVLAAVLSILADCGVIKSEKLAKVVNASKLVLTILAVVFAVLSLVMLIVINQKDMNGMASMGWALIVNLVLAVLGLAAAVASKLLNKKN